MTAAPTTSTTIQTRQFCSQKPQTAPALRPGLHPSRLSAILLLRAKWVNGTVLRYCFLDGENGSPDEQAVDRAFRTWKGVGIGLDFQKVSDPQDAEIRIRFLEGDGSWSYVGRDALGISAREPTMSFGWSLTTDYGGATALHEIGHALGFAHEHQNPFAGIVWDEELVYRVLGGEPNFWPRETTFHNVLRKLSPSEVDGSDWDPDSIMEYGFPPGLVVHPERYRQEGIPETLKLSKLDEQCVLRWYPPADGAVPLSPFEAKPLDTASGKQTDFAIVPPQTRKYQLGTFGDSDVVLALFEDVGGELRYLVGEDDSGEDRNGRLAVKLFQGRRYVARARLYSAWGPGQTCLMYW